MIKDVKLLSRKYFHRCVQKSKNIFRGTEKQHVADDYARRLHVGQVECQVTLT